MKRIVSFIGMSVLNRFHRQQKNVFLRNPIKIGFTLLSAFLIAMTGLLLSSQNIMKAETSSKNQLNQNEFDWIMQNTLNPVKSISTFTNSGEDIAILEFQTIFNIKSLKEIYQQFGKNNVVLNQNTELQFGDFVPTEYIVYKNTDNQFSILFDNHKVGGIVLTENYKGNLFTVPLNLKPGIKLKELAEINKGPFTFNIFLRNLNWQNGILANNTDCFDIYFSTNDNDENLRFYNEMFPKYNLNGQIKFNDPTLMSYQIKVNKVIFFCPEFK